jgi:pimeloyl-ACP methyl ester carboxylesterase
MSCFVLIPGAGGVAWYWHRVVPLLEGAGHEAIAVDLPGDDPEAGLEEYASRTVEAIGARGDVVLVAQSLGGFTVPRVSERAAVSRIVFVNAMIPVPGETPGDWWGNTGFEAARKEAARRGGYSEEFDLETYFLHDVPRDLAEEGNRHERRQSEAIFKEVCDFAGWPDVPINVIAGRDDRFFPIEFQRRIAAERVGKHVDEIAGGHLIALSNPRGLADRLVVG